MRVIIVRGDSDTGKSTTLNLVFDELTGSRYVASTRYKTRIGNPINRDFEAEVILTDNRVVAFYTMGDYDVKYIMKAIKHFRDIKIDVLILASNNGLNTHFDFITNNFAHTIIIKSVANGAMNNIVCNLQDCGTILSLL